MTQELTTTSILSLFDTNREQRATFAISIVEAIQAGNSDPLTIHYQLKCMEDVIKLLNSSTVYKQAVLDAAEKHGERSFAFRNSKVEIKETGVKYDYSQCNDPVLDRMHKEAEELSAQIKARETMLKATPAKGMIVTDGETGETFTVYPPSKSSTTNVAVILK